MSNGPARAEAPVRKATYVFGQDIETMSENDLIRSLASLESELSKLAKAKNPTAVHARKITETREGIETLVAALGGAAEIVATAAEVADDED